MPAKSTTRIGTVYRLTCKIHGNLNLLVNVYLFCWLWKLTHTSAVAAVNDKSTGSSKICRLLVIRPFSKAFHQFSLPFISIPFPDTYHSIPSRQLPQQKPLNGPIVAWSNKRWAPLIHRSKHRTHAWKYTEHQDQYNPWRVHVSLNHYIDSFPPLDTHLPISLKSNPPSNPANFATSAINIFASYINMRVSSTSLYRYNESLIELTGGCTSIKKRVLIYLLANPPKWTSSKLGYHQFSIHPSISSHTYTTELGWEILHKRIYKAQAVRARLIRQSRLRALESAIAFLCRALNILES